MLKLIINADDFGMNEGRTRAIIECFEHNLISNTTIMVNMPYAEQAVALARDAGAVDKIGLHLNLTEGRPLTEDIKKFSLFCDADGAFNGRFHHATKTRLVLPKECQSAVVKELQAQLDRYCALGLTELHLDSHHHSHTDYAVAKLLFPLAKARGFKSVRLSMNLVPGHYGAVKGTYKRLFNWWLTRRFPIRADYFSGFEGVDAHADALDGKVVEIMTHPLRCANGFCDLADQEMAEYETKASDIAAFLCRHKGAISLISYKDLSHHSPTPTSNSNS